MRATTSGVGGLTVAGWVGEDKTGCCWGRGEGGASFGGALRPAGVDGRTAGRGVIRGFSFAGVELGAFFGAACLLIWDGG
jgi:hypothetical protein